MIRLRSLHMYEFNSLTMLVIGVNEIVVKFRILILHVMKLK